MRGLHLVEGARRPARSIPNYEIIHKPRQSRLVRCPKAVQIWSELRRHWPCLLLDTRTARSELARSSRRLNLLGEIADLLRRMCDKGHAPIKSKFHSFGKLKLIP